MNKTKDKFFSIIAHDLRSPISSFLGLSQMLYDNFEISVSDSGVGMDKYTLDRLYRVDKISSTPGTDNEKGTGMGLIICKEFVEFHKGRIWVESAPRKGTVFTFTINKDLN